MIVALADAVSVVPEPKAVEVKLIVGEASSSSLIVTVMRWFPDAVALTGLERSTISVSSHSSIASLFREITILPSVKPLLITIEPVVAVVISFG